MLQKEPLQTHNLKVNRPLEELVEIEDKGSNQSLPIPDVNIDDFRASSNSASEISIPPAFVEKLSTASEINKTDEINLNVDFVKELDRLENFITDGVRVPLTELVVIDEILILDRIDSIKSKIPQELAIAVNIIQRKKEILQKAEEYAKNLLDSTNKQAERIIQRSALIRQAELEATKIKIEAERECQQMRQEAQKEIQEWQEVAIADYENIQNGADEYARGVLGNLEGQLSQMLGIIRNGYEQLEPKTVQDRANHQQ